MGTVIKAGGAGKLKTSFKQLALRDHMAEARNTLHQARERAGELVANAQRESAVIHESASASGFRSGHAEGFTAGAREGREEAYRTAREEFTAQQSHVATLLAQLAHSFESGKQKLLERAERDLLEFAVALAGQMARTTGRTERQAAVENVREAVRAVGAWTDLLIRVNPADHEAVGEYADGVRQSLDDRRHIRICDDPTIDPGGCVVESSTARIDATLETQFAELVKLVLGQGGAKAGSRETES